MNSALFIIGIFVFFISVYGAVMLGGHLLAELDDDLDGIDGRRTSDTDAVPAPVGDGAA